MRLNTILNENSNETKRDRLYSLVDTLSTLREEYENITETSKGSDVDSMRKLYESIQKEINNLVPEVEPGSIYLESVNVIAEEVVNETAYDYLMNLKEEIKCIREEVKNGFDKQECKDEISIVEDSIKDFTKTLVNEGANVERQFRRYGDRFHRQYRCKSGPKKNMMVSSPEKCGTRKDPKRVRLGKRSARSKRKERVRKTLFTKRRTPSKRLSRLNKRLRGEY